MPKRRGNNDGSYRQRPDGTWEVRITLPNGKRKSLYGKTHKEVQRTHREALDEMDRGLDLGARARPLARFLDEWIAVVGPTLRPKTLHSYRQLIRLYITPALGHVQLGKLTTGQVQRMLTEMGEREGKAQTVTYKRGNTTVTYTRQAQKLSPRTIAYTRDVLRIALNQAVAWGLLTRNVAAVAKPPRAERTPVQPLTTVQAGIFIDHLTEKNHPLLALLTTAIHTGMRQAELMGLRWRDVDLTAGTVHVRHALQRITRANEDGEQVSEWAFVEPKSKRSVRTLSLTQIARDTLIAHKDRQAFERKQAGDLWHDLDLVFTTARGTPLEPSNLNGRLHRLLDACGLPRQGMHSLRHCCASVMLGEGVPARVVMEQLGHAQISLTMDTYSHVMPAMLDEAASKMDEAFARVKRA